MPVIVAPLFTSAIANVLAAISVASGQSHLHGQDDRGRPYGSQPDTTHLDVLVQHRIRSRLIAKADNHRRRPASLTATKGQ